MLNLLLVKISNKTSNNSLINNKLKENPLKLNKKLMKKMMLNKHYINILKLFQGKSIISFNFVFIRDKDSFYGT